MKPTDENTYMIQGSETYKDSLISLNIYQMETAADFWTYLRADNFSDSISNNYNRAMNAYMRKFSTGDHISVSVAYTSYTTNSYETLASGQAGDIEADTWYTLTASAIGTSLYCEIALASTGELLSSASATDDTYAKGYSGFGVRHDAVKYFTDFTVTDESRR